MPKSVFETPDERVAVVYMSDPERRVSNPANPLRGLYGLTKAEAMIAAGLMQGHSLEQIAQQLGISLNTVRTHIKRVFAKTATSRQGELVSLLLRGPAQLRLSSRAEYTPWAGAYRGHELRPRAPGPASPSRTASCKSMVASCAATHADPSR